MLVPCLLEWPIYLYCHPLQPPMSIFIILLSNNLSCYLASEDTLCHFAASLADKGIKFSSIQSYLTGIRQLHISLEFCLPLPVLCHIFILYFGVLGGSKQAQVSQNFPASESPQKSSQLYELTGPPPFPS